MLTTWKLFVSAFGLALILEGAVYFALPDLSKQVIQSFLAMHPRRVRKIGLFIVAIGLTVMWLAGLI